MNEQTRILTALAQDLGEADSTLGFLEGGYGPQDLRPWEFDELQQIYAQLYPERPMFRFRLRQDH